MSDSKKILVPTDFTVVADCALNHAATLGKVIQAEVNLLHVVEKTEGAAGAKEKLEAQIAKVKADYPDVVFNYHTRIGSIFEDIGDAAAEIGATMIIMGTHGMKGLQYLIGSNALRVITNSSVPFVVVQERKIREDGYKHIVVPLDLHKETRQKLTLVGDMAKYFGSRVHLITPNEDDEFLSNQLKRNIQFGHQYLKDRGIEHEATIAREGEDFAKEVIRLSIKVDADMIAIMNLKQNSLLGMLGGSYEQDMITNEPQIPVMCMNPKDTTSGGGGWTFQ
jgi:nucleotide-binding universal stress UspA family protein